MVTSGLNCVLSMRTASRIGVDPLYKFLLDSFLPPKTLRKLRLSSAAFSAQLKKPLLADKFVQTGTDGKGELRFRLRLSRRCR